MKYYEIAKYVKIKVKQEKEKEDMKKELVNYALALVNTYRKDV